MQIDDLEVDDLEEMQKTANKTMTRIILWEMEIVGTVAKTKMMIVEPLTLEITTNA
jgi:hypothetical protein